MPTQYETGGDTKYGKGGTQKFLAGDVHSHYRKQVSGARIEPHVSYDLDDGYYIVFIPEDRGNIMSSWQELDVVDYIEEISPHLDRTIDGAQGGSRTRVRGALPQNGRPQSPMLPLHHLGHGLVYTNSSLNRVNLLAYPYSYSMKTSIQKKRPGAYYTHPRVAEFLVRWAVRDRGEKIRTLLMERVSF